MKINKIILLLLMFSNFSYCKDKSNVEAKESEISKPTKKSEIENYEKTLYIDARGGLRMRDDFELNSKVITLIPEREEVQAIERTKDNFKIDGKEDRWVKVKFKEHTGWVFGGFLNSDRPFKCMNLTKQNLDQFEGGCLGEGCRDNEVFFQILFNKDKTTYFNNDVRDTYSGGNWEIKNGEIIVEFDYRKGGDCKWSCQEKQTMEEQNFCIEECDKNTIAEYGKEEAKIEVKYRFFIKGGSFYSIANSKDPDPVPGKNTFKYHHAHSEPKKYGCMHYFKGEGEEN
ncbi:MAG: SH3 domain-containing protein [Leptospiraceae bacterium]|nr:SH3 domain-containing protein [Leptospiraceae bacterium]